MNAFRCNDCDYDQDVMPEETERLTDSEKILAWCFANQVPVLGIPNLFLELEEAEDDDSNN